MLNYLDSVGEAFAVLFLMLNYLDSVGEAFAVLFLADKGNLVLVIQQPAQKGIF